MRVKVEYTVDVSDEYRRAICNFYGEDRLATREEVRSWLESYGSSQNDDLMWDLSNKEREVEDAEIDARD